MESNYVPSPEYDMPLDEYIAERIGGIILTCPIPISPKSELEAYRKVKSKFYCMYEGEGDKLNAINYWKKKHKKENDYIVDTYYDKDSGWVIIYLNRNHVFELLKSYENTKKINATIREYAHNKQPSFLLKKALERDLENRLHVIFNRQEVEIPEREHKWLSFTR